jgi:hypothetical protein
MCSVWGFADVVVVASQKSLLAFFSISLGSSTLLQTSLGMSMHFSTASRLGTSVETSLHSFLGFNSHFSMGMLEDA